MNRPLLYLCLPQHLFLPLRLFPLPHLFLPLHPFPLPRLFMRKQLLPEPLPGE